MQPIAPDDETVEAAPNRALDPGNSQCLQWLSTMRRAELLDVLMILMTSDDIDKHALRRHLARFEAARVTDERGGSGVYDADAQPRTVSVHAADSAKRFAREEGVHRLPSATRAIDAAVNVLGRPDLGRAATLLNEDTTCTSSAAEAHLMLGGSSSLFASCAWCSERCQHASVDVAV